MKEVEKVRIDKYLWSIRIFKTRSLASAGCESGRVKMNGAAVKAARSVAINDVYEIRTEGRKWVIQVTGLLANRVQYTEAIKYYNDITPEEDKHEQRQASVFQTGKRPSKIGRPTKKERRELDDFMGGEEEDF
ncbi:RNA-binding S4 domain-containing protein [Chitinophaga filiformis]|uniref:RNA-binding S4 domain-containing protein n=1 Tax=Chitinophaga filiformis TaxID=104663 RepID=A0ABY4I5C2_CHIFI|nr:RNA-binding S4 domain-containing protein [Chitinophaga filiformis]UPK71042.1 RNA-binding S4 domain-containing protein [Chitinophaga filiformis]